MKQKNNNIDIDFWNDGIEKALKIKLIAEKFMNIIKGEFHGIGKINGFVGFYKIFNTIDFVAENEKAYLTF